MPEVKPKPRNTVIVKKGVADKQLTVKQQAFVKHLAMGESINTATLRAGYEVAIYGYEMMHLPHIKAALAREREKFETASNMTRAKIMEQFAEAYDMAKLVADPHAMVSATREAAKMLGYYEPVKRKVEISINGNGRSRELAVMSNEELAKLVDESTDFGQGVRDVIEEVDSDS
jgi:phage terminase small subunit